ncbi:hypothetical protein MPTK1_6g13810 [Marchantia polymorpha subsp. ruderalis]|uniref:Uncharacterized protein n=2 Tax=Marchantia polymorpha TaxID=3197 RepID=A0AAF6BRS7_MARPO|nr:hypothetical protein MARPO_0047s0032 [Marchantia polymorpha]BBN14711.1 hypothetical protein Mp_6g13810 [Marchantia polymorpha subsp. ruderalis]|eukprot:PTQ39049.1 hypothetical protein MARPO_0047s0032 [Marchantia polymorpha]
MFKFLSPSLSSIQVCRYRPHLPPAEKPPREMGREVLVLWHRRAPFGCGRWPPGRDETHGLHSELHLSLIHDFSVFKVARAMNDNDCLWLLEHSPRSHSDETTERGRQRERVSSGIYCMSTTECAGSTLAMTSVLPSLRACLGVSPVELDHLSYQTLHVDRVT